MVRPITHVLRAVAEHLPWVFADDWFTIRSSHASQGGAIVRMESHAYADPASRAQTLALTRELARREVTSCSSGKPMTAR